LYGGIEMKKMLNKKISFSRENIVLTMILILSGILNFANIGKEGYANQYYAAAAKSMTASLKNFFFVAFDPAGFVTIDKPPVGYWLQAISAKIFGYHGWSIILPQALAGVLSVFVLYIIVKKAFGNGAGLISALCLAVTPVFVAVSRNNSVDNVLVLALLLACWALSIAAEKGKFKYLILCMVLIGIGFNIKMLQAYLIIPAVYVTYLLSTCVSFKKRLLHLAVGTVVLVGVSLSWALIVDSVPASSRPYVDSSTNNTVMELILGHNGLERISLNSSSNTGNGNPGGGYGKMNPNTDSGTMNSITGAGISVNSTQNQKTNNINAVSQATKSGGGQNFQGGTPPNNGQGFPGTPPSGDGQRGMSKDGGRMGASGGNGSSGLQGTFGGETKAGLTRLFSKNILSDQIVWFIPLALFGFLASALREKLKFRLDNKRKQAIVLWFMWLLPEFIYFSFNTGTFHSYYLTMLAPPIAALAGIGMTQLWELYKSGGFKAWLLPIALITNGAVQLLMLSYFYNSSVLMNLLIVGVIVLCIVSSIILFLLNNNHHQSKLSKFKKIIAGIALAGLIITPLAGSSAAVVNTINSSFPAAGLELISSNNVGESSNINVNKGGNLSSNTNTSLIEFLKKNKTNEKYLLVVSTANEAAGIITETGESVMALGGFLGNNNPLTLDEFKTMVKNGEIRYVMTGGNGGRGGQGGSNSEIMNWVAANGKVVSSSEYSNTASTSTSSQKSGGFGESSNGQLYDLISYTKK
jgi:4-amino-4-deoxy-L-arabinose transferase-like glycosyltransferase